MVSERPAEPSRPTPEEMARNNPRVDLAKLREAEEAMRELRARGVPRPTNSVRTPYGQRLVRFVRDDDRP